MDSPLLPSVQFQNCPIRTSLGVLGKRWTMLVLRDIGFLKVDRFNQSLRTLPGLTPRVLAMRLRELEGEGFIKQIEVQNTPRIVRWGLTPKGDDTLPILMGLIGFGSKWYPDVVFADKKPRTPDELFPNRVKFDPVIR